MRNVFNGLNHSITGEIHAFHKTDPNSYNEWASFRGEPIIASKEFNLVGTEKCVDGSFACEQFKRIRNKVVNRNPDNFLKRKNKDIQ